MGALFDPASLSDMFTPSSPLIATFVRGTIVYLALYAMLRFVIKRGSVSTASMTDLLLLVLIGNAVQNALIGESNSITDGILLVATIIFWSYVLDWLSYRFRLLRRFAFPERVKLIENGKLLRENMEKELITEEQLRAVLRTQGIEDVSEVKEASIEPNGQISVIPFDGPKDKGGAAEPPNVI